MKGCVSALVLASLPMTTLADTRDMKNHGYAIELIEYSGDTARIIATYNLADAMARIRCIVAKEIIIKTSKRASRFSCGLVV